MSRHLFFWLGVLALTAGLTTGCVTDTSQAWGDNSSGYSTEDPAGSVASINRKLKGEAEAKAAKETRKNEAETANSVVLLVTHDAGGRPTYVETRRSSGDADLDRRAQEHVLKTRSFPKGAPNTVLLTLKRSQIPKQ